MRPLTEKDGQGGERVRYECVGNVWGKILENGDAKFPNLRSIQRDQVRVMVKDISGSGMSTGWKLSSDFDELLVQDFDRIGIRDAIVLARREHADAL